MHAASSPFRKFSVGNLGALLAALRTCVTARELLDTACGIDELLLTSEERVAGSANTDLDVPTGRTGVIRRTARAVDRGGIVVRMNFSFHGWRKRARNLTTVVNSANKKSE